MKRLVRGALALAAALWAATAAAQVTVTDDRGHRITLARPAQRIVSLLPSLTETVCALQACARLVGVDRFSNWPAQVQRLPQLGALEDTQIERLVALKPDLVLVAVSARAADRLQALGLQVLALEPQDGAGARRAIAVVAQALGMPEAAPALQAQIEARVAAAAARVPPAMRGRAVYFEVASEPSAAGESSWLGQLLSRLPSRRMRQQRSSAGLEGCRCNWCPSEWPNFRCLWWLPCLLHRVRLRKPSIFCSTSEGTRPSARK